MQKNCWLSKITGNMINDIFQIIKEQYAIGLVPY